MFYIDQVEVFYISEYMYGLAWTVPGPGESKEPN